MGILQPGYKPSLVMVFACLGDIHAERHQKTKRKADLDEAVSATRLALSISSADHPINTTLLNNLANGLWQRYQYIQNEDDLHQALFYGLQALDSISHDDSNRAAASVLATLGAIRASFYECQGEYQNIQEAIAITRKSIDLTTGYGGATPLALLNNLGAYLWTQYCFTGRREDLDQSVSSFSKALEIQTDIIADRVSCLINCVQVLNRRYHRTGQLEDLSCALEIAQEATRLDPGNADLATLLKHLDHFLDRRRGNQLRTHWSKAQWKTRRGLWKPLILLAALATTIAMHHYHFRNEILLSVIAFPCGLMFHSFLSRTSHPERKTTKNTSRSLTFMGMFFGSRAEPQEYSLKLLAVPLIPVPFTSSLRGIQTSDVSAYSSLLHNQRRQSMHSVKSDRASKRRRHASHGRGQDTQVHMGRHYAHQPMSPPSERQPGMPATTPTTMPSILVRHESPKRHFSIALRTARPQAEVEFPQNNGSMQESIHTDSGYGSYKIHDRAVDEDQMDEDQNIITTSEQKQQPPNTPPDSYSQPAAPQNTRNAEQTHVPSESPLIPSQNPWSEPAESYLEHKVWEEYKPPSKLEKEGNVRVISQGHTRLEMNANSGLAMGNVTSRRAAIVGYVASGETQPQRQSSYHEAATTGRCEATQRRIIFQEEEVKIASVQDISDSQDTASEGSDASVEDIEVQIEAPVPSGHLASIVDNLIQSQEPRIVEVEEDDDDEGEEEESDPVLAEQGSDLDLVDQLAWEYMKESSTL